ncbi:EamA family transporter [Mycoplasma todarodis]|uniref:EamA family transporter n=1 Tax=Mycoplasma todarodis TaxID=1937191 RepID=UPI003B297BDD
MKQRLNPKNRKLGIFAASGVVLTQGFEAVLLPLLFYATFMFEISNNNGIAYSAGIMSLKELFSLIIAVFYLGPKIIKHSLKLMSQKKNIWFVLSGTFGTAMGNIFFIVGIVMAGPSYGVILTAFYPIFAIGLNKLVYKENDNWVSKLGMLISILSGALFVILPVLISGGTISAWTIGGMCCGLLAGFFWALEGFFLRIAMDKNPEVKQKEAIAIRTISVAITTWVLIVPISIGVNYAITGDVFNTYTKLIGRLFYEKQAWIVWLVLFFAGLNVIILRIMHTTAIKYIGQKLTAIIDTNNFIIPSIFALVLQFLPGNPGLEFTNSLLAWYLWFLLLPLSVGLTLVLVYHGKSEIKPIKELIRKTKNEENPPQNK